MPNTPVFDPLFSEVLVGGSHSLADFAAGSYKDSAQQSGGSVGSGGVATIAYSGLEATFKNTGAGAIAFGAGDISATIDASFMRAMGGCCGSQNGTTLIAVLGGRTDTATRIDGAARSTYQVGEAFGAAPFFTFDLTFVSGGFTATGSADLVSQAVILGFPAFTLAPDQSLEMHFSLQAVAVAGPLAGWEATTDAFNSAQLSMQLPAGVTLQSSVPLAWVSSVPEPSSWALLAFGLCAVVGTARLQARTSGHMPDSWLRSSRRDLNFEEPATCVRFES